jgi:hypothetical protein
MIELRSVVRRIGAPLFLAGWAMAASADPQRIFGVTSDGTGGKPATPGNISTPGTAAWAQSQFLGLLKPESVASESFTNSAVGATFQGATGIGALNFVGSGGMKSASMRPSAPLPSPGPDDQSSGTSGTNEIPQPPLQNPGLVAATGSAQFAGRFNTTGGFSNGAWASGKWWEATGDFKIEFDSGPVSAFGFFLTDAYDFKGTLKLLLEVVDPPLGTPTTEVLEIPGTSVPSSSSLIFYGFTDRQKSYRSVTFDITQSGTVPLNFDVFGLDDMIIGELATPGGGGDLPEPATLALVAASLGALAATRRRRPR